MDKQQEQPVENLRVYPYRYVCLLLYFLAALVNVFAPSCLIAIARPFQNIYGVSNVVVNLNSLAYTVMHLFIMFPASYIVDQIGLKKGLSIANLFFVIGYCLKLFINQSVWLFIVGTYVTSFGFILVLNSPTKFINTWFPVNQIALANSLVMFALLASDAFGVFVPVMFVNQNSTKDDVFRLVVFQTIFVGGIHILMFLFLRAKPPTPANYSSTVKKESYMKSLRELLKNKNYVLIFLCMMFVWGTVTAFFVTASYQMGAYGYQSKQVGLVVLFSNTIGVLGSICFGVYLQKSRKYKLTCIITSLGGVLSLVIFVVFLELVQSAIPLYVMSSLAGFFLIPYIATLTQLSTEVAFPVGEATSGGSIFGGGQLFGFILGISIEFLFDGVSKSKTRIGMGIYIFLLLIGFSLMFLVKEDLRKYNFEKQEQEKKKLISGMENSYSGIN